MAVFSNQLMQFLKIKQLACKQVAAGTPLVPGRFSEAPRICFLPTLKHREQVRDEEGGRGVQSGQTKFLCVS